LARQTGTGADGGSFTIPNLIMEFLNDHQIAEMTAAIGIFDHEEALSDTHVLLIASATWPTSSRCAVLLPLRF
jgi:hypothetical protein